MATQAVRKTLGQTMPGAATDSVIYTVPAATDTVVSSIVIAETNGAAATFKITIDPAGGSVTTAAKSVAWNVNLSANEVMILKLGATLAAATKVIVQASTANVTFSMFGQENS